MRCGKFILVVVFILLLSSLVYAANVEDLVDDALSADGRADVIVILKDSKVKSFGTAAERFEAKKAAIKNKQFKVMDEHDLRGKTKHVYATVNAFAGTFDSSEIHALENDPDVERIIFNKKLHATLTSSRPVINADDVLSRQINGTNITGDGVTVCVIDSGIDTDHPLFNDRIIAEYCYCDYSNHGSGGCCADATTEDTSGEDDYGHGTHVAGIVAANGSVIGVAPGADLIAMKVMDSNGEGTDWSIAAGIDWCVDHATEYNISIITMSLGTDAFYNESTCPVNIFAIEQAMAVAHEAGIYITAASGNNCASSGVVYPACSPNATSVAASDDSDNMASFSCTGTALDVVAPGVAIVSAAIGGGTVSNQGTSMATPHVAGAAALMIQERRLLGLSDYGHDDIEAVLKNSSIVNVTDGQNFPRIDAFRALYDGCLSATEEQQNITFYHDNDTDTYGDASTNTTYCFAPLDYIANNTDCNDTNSSIYPGATEIPCDGIDQSCNGSDFLGTDNDVDNFTIEGGLCGQVDCNDTDASINPNATEIPCDGIDQNCTGSDFTGTDGDSDSYTAEGGLCGDADCDDTNSTIYPNATETCNYADDDCDGTIDDGVTTTYYEDSDSDAYGNVTVAYTNCTALPGYVNVSTDCDDGNAAIAPNVTETFNGLDDNCNNVTDEGLVEGNSSTINMTSFSDVNLTVDGSDNLSQNFNGTKTVVIIGDNVTVVEYSFDFDTGYVNFTAVTVEKQNNSDSGYVIVRNVTGTKTVYLDDLNASDSGVCIKDAEIDNLGNISDGCNGDDEYSVDCTASGYTANGYTCTDLGSRLKIEGLNHSGVMEFKACTDADGDGYGTGCAAGTDCDDTDNAVNPGESEDCNDNVDNDCDGSVDEGCSSGSSGGSGGGGGGGAIMSGNFSATAGSSETRYFVTISAGSSNSMEVNRDELSVTHLDFVTKSDKDLVRLNVRKVELPSSVPSAGDVYEYFEVSSEELAEGDVSAAVIEFKVSKDFVDEGYEVVLKRYKTVWEELETKAIDADSDYIYYSAETPGFSYFAISQRESIEKEVEVVEADVNETVEPEATVFKTQEEQGSLIMVEEQQPSSKSNALVYVLIILAAIAGFVFFKIKTKPKLKKKNRKIFAKGEF
ncbi:S8 family serine peptidase [Candidatus Woesearchaeota archaeon]|nr:S8 family serine peptidase [Candidatus Woesearchaeota archaeon]MBW3021483.1 S8 family serine peptidase [Candidatus Woesearchaeota archaeon]